MFKLEALQEKPWYIHLAVFGGIALVLYLGFWYFVTGGIRTEVHDMEAQVEELLRANAGAQIASQRLNEFRANLARAQADYDDLKALLPEQRELTMVLQNLQDRTRGKLKLRRFTPKDDETQDFYAAKPVEVQITGTYNNLGQFFAQMATYQRIVSITDFKIMKLSNNLQRDQKEGKTVDATFTLKAYYVAPEQIQPAAPQAKPANAAAAPQPAAANPTAAASAASDAASKAPTAQAPAAAAPKTND
jgi:type IV pilus assembly protein PilO